MTARAEFLAHLDVLTEAGSPPTCWTLPMPDRGLWTSESTAEQRVAARLCWGCPALGACREYGTTTDPREVAGVLGGLTETQRRSGA
ncbi:hypothetical protein GXB85_04190 [Cellulomonas sp. APG4]|uniref:WhiB family transcriptional regulator n=1 Tax=Cellulomonas sp. APG4 TaxID=1538656 RepID=UPI00137A4877|nr:WhiB family transcriptional regulator [Cellulomonas sp. APG4]NCT90153.1 hypothetical protein [Cellulomonas sp. APG4]